MVKKVRVLKPLWLLNTSSFKNPFKKALFTSIWYNLKFIMHAMEKRIRIDSCLATGAKDSSKSMPSTWVYPWATNQDLFWNNFTVFISFVLKYPLSADDMCILGPWYQLPYIISNKLVQLLVHGLYPILILQCFLHFLWFKLSKIAIVCHMIHTICWSFPQSKSFI